ncbi:MAG: hypothetical protein IKC85_00545, partial [Bacteroidaceae bacterium]|nr:hypothetical protein [Bacteroidaceae bacterium]
MVFVKNEQVAMSVNGFRLYKKVNPDNRTVVGIYFFVNKIIYALCKDISIWFSSLRNCLSVSARLVIV